ncbi:hypothetical protein DYD21_15770 [Rhodohalobacter sp. SW132]|uniref:hypothetical protein n=1 Tax=Rhodohalobacter sp. SW132 TaxID=2293433 RepID=UPI000E246CAB|nr:hypothetical protein [Rhodohalobacter sp. SW132]REL24979.1 hypothetical protein DYD21_15770 [Rhodohalobacter sp. SW132]
MNLLLFFITLNLVLISRLRLTFEDDGATSGTILKMAAIPLIVLLLMEVNLTWVLLLITLLLLPIATIYLERNGEKIYRNRLFGLLLYIGLTGLMFSPLLNAEMDRTIVDFLYESGPGAVEMALSVMMLLFGILLVMNEMNTLLRHILKLLKLDPIGEINSTVTDREYNTGRVIGMLERIFIFLFTIAGQYAAIGFILTAKGVVRYKEFENRTFAEYVLIGTLLSALLALLTGLAVRAFV